jgi:hypothetical protein
MPGFFSWLLVLAKLTDKAVGSGISGTVKTLMSFTLAKMGVLTVGRSLIMKYFVGVYKRDHLISST